jgi:hypothetical protein
MDTNGDSLLRSNLLQIKKELLLLIKEFGHIPTKDELEKKGYYKLVKRMRQEGHCFLKIQHLSDQLGNILLHDGFICKLFNQLLI